MGQFLILALPRSRTAWLSAFLDCGHDMAVECGSIAEFRTALDQAGGSVETGAVVAWRAIRHLFPDLKLFALIRPVEQVIASLEKLGVASDDVVAEMQSRAHMLEQFAAQADVQTIYFHELNDRQKCNWLFRECCGIFPDVERWDRLAPQNIQIDVAAQLARIQENRESIEALKAEAAASLPEIEIGLEPFQSIWPEVDVLANSHFDEVDGGIEPNRPFRLDVGLMLAMQAAGSLKIITARVKGELAGYCTWNISPDVESAGLIMANQGAWFVAKEFDRFGLGRKMFTKAVEVLKGSGVQVIFPHHRLQGRGARLGKFFRRMGAKETQHTYSLWIGD